MTTLERCATCGGVLGAFRVIVDGDAMHRRCAPQDRFPTVDAYEAVCKAYWHWRDEAERLAKELGVEPRQMLNETKLKR